MTNVSFSPADRQCHVVHARIFTNHALDLIVDIQVLSCPGKRKPAAVIYALKYQSIHIICILIDASLAV